MQSDPETMRIARELVRSVLMNIDFRAAMNDAMKRDDPLRLVRELKRHAGDDFPVNALVSHAIENISSGLDEVMLSTEPMKEK